MIIKYFIAAVYLLCLFQIGYAQDSLKYVSANNLTIIGKAKKTVQLFQRIDPNETSAMTKPVQELALNSAGIALLFETNSPTIAVRWKLAAEKYMANMTPIAHSGLDLYSFNDGKWQYVSVARPVKGAVNQDQVIIHRMDTTLKQMMLYLPLYNSVNELSVGVNKGCVINSPKEPKIETSKRVVVYGSSIVQGASASRPGMAYPAIIQRKLGVDVVNLGFSGNAKMEIEFAKYLATVEADCYVLDCIPNQTAEQVNERAFPFIKYLKSQKPKVPIILVETVIREHGYFDQQVGENVRKQNEAIKKAYDQLKKEKYDNIYYIAANQFMGNDHDGTIDGTHLTDLGFTRIADAVMKMIKKVM